MKKLLAVLLTLLMCVPCLSGIHALAEGEFSPHVYMIITNPGENMDTQMNIGFHADEGYTNCYIELTTEDDADFAKAEKKYGTYDDQAYKWFYGRVTTLSADSPKFEKVFLDYGVNLTGLTPDTDYKYRVCDGEGGYSETYRFKTAGQDEFSILWLSDMHLTNGTSDYELEKYVKTQAAADYVIPLAKYDIGLNFNTGDVVGCGDRYGFWQKYYDMDFMKNYTYAATVGNHDLYDSMMDDVPEYTEFWKSANYFKIVSNYPNNAYRQTSSRILYYMDQLVYQRENGNKPKVTYADKYGDRSADVLFPADKGRLRGKLITGADENMDGKAYWFLYNRLLFIVFNYYGQTWNAELPNAFNWANKVIEANKGKYDYIIATEHINLFLGQDGMPYDEQPDKPDNLTAYDRYKPWIDQAGVDIFCYGHNHIYFRSDPICNGENTTDPEKGCYMMQGCATTNTGGYGHQEGPVGFGVNTFSDKGWLGAIVLDVDKEGIHGTVAVGTGVGEDLHVYDTFTLRKKVRYIDKEKGYYKTENDVPLYETTDTGSTVLATIPKDTLIEVYDTNGIWCKIRCNGMSGWARLTSEQCLFIPETPSAYEEFAIAGYNQGYATDGLWVYDKGYTNGNGTIANGGWTFADNIVMTAIEQEDGSYVITEINDSKEPKSTTPLIDNGLILMCDGKYEGSDKLVAGYRFTFDWANSKLNQADPNEEAPLLVIPDKVTVRFVAGEHGALEGEAEFSADYGADLSAVAPPTPVPDKGYVFAGWDKTEGTLIAAVTVVTANFEPTAGEPGDVNDDGEVDNLDAALVLQYDAGIAAEADLLRFDMCDVNGDDEVDNLDATLILQFDAGIIEGFEQAEDPAAPAE